MKRLHAGVLLTALMLVAGDCPAQGAPMARVVTHKAMPEQCMSAVAITQVDGQDRTVSHMAFELEPGRHALAGRVLLDTRHCPVPRNVAPHMVPPLEWQFEANKTYFVGFDHGSADVAQWKYVVWQVE